ncbi:MFS transporter [Streptomyces polyrhachis]|uniref:MFS transporter n=1 Tax=Streptomyces polyrhachis TaxID=1282885 RepID=A0ABW2GNE8_9ACTN
MSELAGGVKSPNFRKFWAALGASQLGQRFGFLAIPVVAIETLNAGSDEVGYLSASLTVCYLLVGLPAGAWIDRWRKRSTMMRSALIRALAIATVPAMWALDLLSLEWLYVVSIIIGIASVFFDVACQSYLPTVVSDDAIEPANARLETTGQMAAAGGPAVAGLLLRVLSAPLVLVLDALAYAMCVGFLWASKDGEKARSTDARESSRLATEIYAGVEFVAKNSILRRLTASMAVSNFFATIIMTLLPLLILRTLDLGATAMGCVLGLGTLGGLLGSVLLPRVRNRFSAGTVMAGGLLIAASFTAVTPLTGGLEGEHAIVLTLLLTLGQFGTMFGAVMFNITQVSIRQRVCPKELLARMTASIRFVVWGSMPLAAITAGWLGGSLGIVGTMWLGVVGTCVTALPLLGMDRLIKQSVEETVLEPETTK